MYRRVQGECASLQGKCEHVLHAGEVCGMSDACQMYARCVPDCMCCMQEKYADAVELYSRAWKTAGKGGHQVAWVRVTIRIRTRIRIRVRVETTILLATKVSMLMPADIIVRTQPWASRPSPSRQGPHPRPNQDPKYPVLSPSTISTMSLAALMH